MDRGAWWASVHRVAKSQTQLKQLSPHAESQTSTYIWEFVKKTFHIKETGIAYKITNTFEDIIMLIMLWYIFKAIHKAKFKMD